MRIDNKQINRAIDYIVQHLADEIHVDDVATHCNLSKFHFSRLFKQKTGESVYFFIKRLKMEASAIYIGTNANKSITDIGMRYGYSSSNFSTAFTKHHHLSPVQFRRLKRENQFDLTNPFDNTAFIYRDYQYYNSKIKIHRLDDLKIVFERYIGNYREMKVLWPRFIKRYQHLLSDETLFIDIGYNDPNLASTERCLYDICMTVNDAPDLENTKILPGGRFATFTYKGPISKINQAYKGLFNVWLPKSGYEMDYRLGFDSFSNSATNHAYHEMEINIPIK